ncbi:hypothetical protein CDD80_4286 [Ophiocordyceps camponoti-rufipedis]|uniref:Uncharacterized protein n=1 Tax=Ophiocordyceps camponoti-rufipedis TaxID=2004952 RepID=A0A2C5YYP6_9HYPO|nr:hypothetical protein CDD80_4286 [Ophiocordyceps camponoti-rufipedis]
MFLPPKLPDGVASIPWDGVRRGMGWLEGAFDSAWEWLKSSPFDPLVDWLSRSHAATSIIIWAATFSIVIFIIPWLGFGPAGIVLGSLAAWFQSFMYGGFTPAGALFAQLTSIAMTGMLFPLALILAAVIATVVVIIVWICGGGR